MESSYGSMLSDTSSSSIEPEVKGHRRVQSDGGLAKSAGTFSHSPRGGTEVRVQQRARQLYERLISISPSPLHRPIGGKDGRPSFCAEELLSWMVSIREFPSRPQAAAFLQQLQASAIVCAAPGVCDCNDHHYFNPVSSSRPYSTAIMDNLETHMELPQEIELLIAGDDAEGMAAALSADDDLGNMLLRAAKAGASSVVRLLIGRGADPNMAAPDGLPLLHGATVKGDRKVMLALLDLGANIELRSASGKTPLMLAASNRKLLECALLLLEYGASVHAKDSEGVRSSDIQPEFVEAQRRLCQAAASGLAAPAARLPSLQMVARLSTNKELAEELCEKLSSLPIAAQVQRLCLEHEEAILITCKLLHALFPEAKRSLEGSSLSLLLSLLSVKGKVRDVVVGILVQFCGSLQDSKSSCSQLSRVRLLPLLLAMEESADHRPQLSAILADVTQFPRAQPGLGDPATAAALLSTARALIQSGEPFQPGAEDVVVNVLRTVSNACMAEDSHATLLGLGARSLLQPLLQWHSKEVRFLAARALILLGDGNVGSVNLFEPASNAWRGLNTERDVITMAPPVSDEESSEWTLIKAASIEKVVGLIFYFLARRSSENDIGAV